MTTNDDDSQSSLQEIIYDASRERVFHCQHFHSKQVLNQNVGSEKVWTPPERPLCGQRKKTKREGDTGKGKREAHGFTVVSPTACSLSSEVVSLKCWVSFLTAFAWSVFERSQRTRYIPAYRTFSRYHSWENETYTCATLVSLLGGTNSIILSQI